MGLFNQGAAALADQPLITNKERDMTSEQLRARLEQGLDAMDISFGDTAINNLMCFMELLHEWNQTHNLTAIHSMDEMLSKHIFDCASIKPYLKGATLLDVGSGAGLPGMVLATLSPALEVTSVETRGKKAQFQMYAASKLKLTNFRVENTRIEDHQPKSKYAMVTARAFSSLSELVVSSKHTITEGGRWLAMKGQLDEEELKALKKTGFKYEPYSLKVPELDAQRHVVVISAAK